MSETASDPPIQEGRQRWLTPGTAGIGGATAVSPTAAFLFAATAMLIALVALRPSTTPA